MKLVILALFIASCSNPIVDAIYTTKDFDDAPLMLKKAIISCKTQCSYTVLASKMMKDKDVPAACERECFYEAKADVVKFLRTYERKVPVDRF